VLRSGAESEVRSQLVSPNLVSPTTPSV
jgi:hypothetical protein